MKRGEMVKIITGRYTNKNKQYDVSQELAELILNVIEENGMLPPKHWNVPEKSKEEPIMSGYHGISGWESEDD